MSVWGMYGCPVAAHRPKRAARHKSGAVLAHSGQPRTASGWLVGRGPWPFSVPHLARVAQRARPGAVDAKHLDAGVELDAGSGVTRFGDVLERRRVELHTRARGAGRRDRSHEENSEQSGEGEGEFLHRVSHAHPYSSRRASLYPPRNHGVCSPKAPPRDESRDAAVARLRCNCRGYRWLVPKMAASTSCAPRCTVSRSGLGASRMSTVSRSASGICNR